MLANWEYFYSWPNLMVLNTALLNNKVRGATWNIDREEVFSTLVQQSQNGREIRILNWQQPIWKFVYRWDYIKDRVEDLNLLAGNIYTDLRTFWGQILPIRGQANDFLYQPDDSIVTLQTLTVDSSGNAELVHNIGGYQESVQYFGPGSLFVYFNGVAQAAPTIALPGTVPPYLGYVIQGVPASTVVTASFVYYYRCTLDVDNRTYENFMDRLWTLKELRFRQVRI